ncbi:hypothetical protein DSO57_1019141 [Entomophthora muscae]|uniref:Uncharacterized protein n=1 Tax=Entomophthora muscae TaxID=34485 RepID=A0ACC2S697_9FUNG|nr:hypothetical protein DSO57_1019141 [Entomophthora muscae]
MISSLFVACVFAQAASSIVKSPIRPITYISEATKDVETNRWMALGSGFKWPGRGDFCTYHQTKGTAHLSNLCEEENKFIEAYYCFQNPSQKDRFGEVIPVSSITVCLEPKFHVITEATIAIGITKEKWTRNSPAAATKLM